MKKKTSKPMGRPPKNKADKYLNPVRQIGRWPDEDWQLIKAAAQKANKTVAEWARDILLPAARRQLKQVKK